MDRCLLRAIKVGQSRLAAMGNLIRYFFSVDPKAILDLLDACHKPLMTVWNKFRKQMYQRCIETKFKFLETLATRVSA